MAADEHKILREESLCNKVSLAIQCQPKLLRPHEPGPGSNTHACVVLCCVPRSG